MKSSKKRTSKKDEERESKKSKPSDEIEYTIEKIIGKRIYKGIVEYLVKWEDYPDGANSWEPEDQFSEVSIRDYEDSVRDHKAETLRRWQSGYTVSTSGINIEKDVHKNMDTLSYDKIPSKSGRFIEEDEYESHYDNYYNCKYKEYKCILKFPTAFLERKYCGIVPKNGKICILGSEKEKRQKKADIFSLPGEPLERYKEECRIASELLDSKEHIKHRNPDARAQIKPDSVNDAVLDKIERQMKTKREHPGYSRIYPIRYVDANECFSIGKNCDGIIGHLIQGKAMSFNLNDKENDTFGKIPQIWLSLAYQMGQAILFMRNLCKMSHVNINQDNILYEKHKESQGIAFYLSGFSDCYKSSDDPDDLGLYNFALFLVGILTKHTGVAFTYRLRNPANPITKQTDYSTVSHGDRIIIVKGDGQIENAFILAKEGKQVYKIIMDEDNDDVIEQDFSERSFVWSLTSSLDFRWHSEDTDIEIPHIQHVLELLENILNSTGSARYEEFCTFLKEVEKYLIPTGKEVDFKKIQDLIDDTV
jgi:hypothetical protein